VSQELDSSQNVTLSLGGHASGSPTMHPMLLVRVSPVALFSSPLATLPGRFLPLVLGRAGLKVGRHLGEDVDDSGVFVGTDAVKHQPAGLLDLFFCLLVGGLAVRCQA